MEWLAEDEAAEWEMVHSQEEFEIVQAMAQEDFVNMIG